MKTDSNKTTRIAKNTLFLYFRMMFTIIVKLYTSRVVLEILGIDDYGVYTVVGGIVVMFSFFTNSLSSAISRYLTYTLGKDDIEEQKKVFSTSVSILFVVLIILILIIEIIAPWFLQYRMNIPEGRMFAAQCCLQLTIVTFAINLLSVPYNAMIIAHERMSIYAYISIVEVILQLLVVLSLSFCNYDKLIFYGVMMAAVAVLIRILYGVYCKWHFEECEYRPIIDKKLAKEIFGFTSWSLLGNGAYVMNNQGINIIMNIFFGVTINAARGIADQVHAAMMQFLTSFTTALNPQIVKSYASGDIEYVNKLVCSGAKFSFYMSLFMAIPLLLETENILHLWLKNYPPYAPVFIQLSVIGTMIDFVGNTTARAVWATGKVRRYYVVTSCISMMVMPISWVCYYFGMCVEMSYYIFIIAYILLIPTRLYILKGLMSFSPRFYFINVLLPIVPVTLCALTLPVVAHLFFASSFLRLLLVVACTILSMSFSIYSFGVTSQEREYLNNRVFAIVRKYVY